LSFQAAIHVVQFSVRFDLARTWFFCLIISTLSDRNLEVNLYLDP